MGVYARYIAIFFKQRLIIKFIDDKTKIPTGVKITIPKAAPEDYIKVSEDFYLRKRPTPVGLELNNEQVELRNLLEEKTG